MSLTQPAPKSRPWIRFDPLPPHERIGKTLLTAGMEKRLRDQEDRARG